MFQVPYFSIKQFVLILTGRRFAISGSVICVSKKMKHTNLKYQKMPKFLEYEFLLIIVG